MYDKLAYYLKTGIERWTAKSPKAYKTITNVSVGIGIAATVASLLPLSYPIWAIQLIAFGVAFSAKMTVEK